METEDRQSKHISLTFSIKETFMYVRDFTRLDKSTNALFFFKLNLHRGDRSVKKEEYRRKKVVLCGKEENSQLFYAF